MGEHVFHITVPADTAESPSLAFEAKPQPAIGPQVLDGASSL